MHADGYEEDGVDEGGLTTELHALFWREAAQPEACLFECGDGGGGDEDGGSGGGGNGGSGGSENGGGVLPRADASEEAMVGVGLMACKGVVDDHPVGAPLAPFVFEYLVHGDDAPALKDVRAALAALRGFDAPLATSWSSLLRLDSGALDALQLTRENFGEDDPARVDEQVTKPTLRGVLLAACARRLCGARRPALGAMRRGFMMHEDLTLQLGCLPPGALRALLQGKVVLSEIDLLSCFDPPFASATAAAAAGFEPDSPVPSYFEQLLRDKGLGGLTAEQRLQLLSFCTGLGALPPGGLRDDKIKLRPLHAGGDEHKVEARTCSRELLLPAYSSAARLREMLLRTLDWHAAAGSGGFYAA